MAKKITICSLPEMNKERLRNNKILFDYENISVPHSLVIYAKNKKYFIRTYGCQANYRDEEIMSGLLELAGYKKANTENDADFILLNTCAVRENAEDKVFGKIGDLKNLKANKQDLIIAICGCMVQQRHMIDKLINTYRHVDLIFGTHNAYDILTMLNEVIVKGVRLVDVKSLPGDIKENLPSIRTSKFKAFVNISYGCDKFCTYCIVPYTRGKERSRKMEDIILECKKLQDDGYKEVTLLGQNVNAYGKDLNDGSSFALLLDKVSDLNIPRIRFLTSHPWDFTSDIIDVIAKKDNIMKYIHLPVQSGSDEVLRLMGRRYTSVQYKKLVDEIKTKIPGIALSTDIIVGFPNESEEQFIDTLKMVEYVNYDSAFTFIYSPRDGTPAAKIVDNVPIATKSQRFKTLVKTLENIIAPKRNALVGKTLDVLVESVSEKDATMLSSYSERNELIHFKGTPDLIGKIVKVKIVESHLYSLIGELVDE